MATIKKEDFKQTSLSVEDFTSQKEGFKVNDTTASQIAATDTILGGGGVETYQSLKSDLVDADKRPHFFNNEKEITNTISLDAKPSAKDMVADEGLPDEDRLVALKVATDDLDVKSDNNLTSLAQEAIIANSGEETDESAELRGGLVDSVPRMILQKMEDTRRINEYVLTRDDSFGDKVVDFAEIILPYAEWIHFERMGNAAGIDVSDFALMGNIKDKLFNSLQNVPVEQRALITEELFQFIENHDTVVLPDGNTMLTAETLHNMMVNNEYGNFEKWFDNFTSLLDIAGVAGAARWVARGRAIDRAASLKSVLNDVDEDQLRDLINKMDDPEAEQEVVFNTVRTEAKPTSPSQVVKDHNPEDARRLHLMVAEDPSDETAKALYGTTREDALASDILPEPAKLGGPIKNKVDMPKPDLPEPENLRKARTRKGNTEFSKKERQKVNKRITADFREVEGMRLHKESLNVSTNLNDTINVVARYSPKDSGFKSAARALSNARFAFREYGLQDDAFTLLIRDGDKWVPISQKDLKAKALLREEFSKKKKKIPEELKDFEYSVALDFDYKVKPEDLEVDELLSTGNVVTRMLEALPQKLLTSNRQGSIVQHLFDPSSSIAARIVNPASVAVDRVIGTKKLYVEQFEEFNQVYTKLDKDRRAKMADYIHDANFNGIPLSVKDLRARGFDSKEIEALKTWRRANDAMWYASNDDMVKTLRANGTKAIIHDDSNTKLFGRPLPRSEGTLVKQVYDPTNGDILQATELSKLYDEGGEIVRLNDPIKINDDWVDEVLVRNTPEGGYTRSIYDGETVLAYREGYYPIMYDANWFVEMKIKKVNGSEGVKVVGAAKSLKEAKALISRLKETEGPDVEFKSPRRDRKSQDRGDLFDEGSWSMATNAGLTSQRLRGELLQDASSTHKMGKAHLEDPLRAVSAQVNSLAQRVSMRDTLQTFKNRWMQTYGDQLGLTRFPDSVSDIKGTSDTPTGLTSDAKTNFNYIYSLENGYLNLIDEGVKGTLNVIGETLAKAGLGKAEGVAFDLAKLNPTQRAKILAFRFFIASHPLRQALIQRGQMLQIGAINPQYLVKDMMQDIVMLRLASRGVVVNKRYAKLWDEIKDSGIIEAVDAHTLIRDDMLRMADTTVAQKAGTILNKPLELSQRVGFDAAEQDVLLSSWLAHRDLAKRQGLDITQQRVKDSVLGQARAYTLNMNRSGDFAYNQNTLGLIAQFFSFRHKALLQPLTNKSLSKKDRAKLALYTTAVFGFDASVYGSIVQSAFSTKEPSEVKDILTDGFLHTTLNAVATQATGKDQNVNWGDFAPTEAYGIGNIFTGMLTTDLGEMVANSPGGSLVLGHNPRLTDAFKTGLRFFYPSVDYTTPELQTNAHDVLKAGLNVFSGFSNAFKAQYAFNARKKLSSTGKVSDKEVTAFEAAMAAFGFSTEDEEGFRLANELLYKDGGSPNMSDVDKWYKELKRHLTRRNVSPEENAMFAMVMAEAFSVWEDREKVINRIASKLEKDAEDRDFLFIQNMIRQMGFMKDEDVWKIINKLPDNETRTNLTNLMKQREEMLNGN